MDSQPPGFSNPVALDGLGVRTTDAELVFELLVAEEAEVVGRYTTDFYAGRPAVTRRRYPSGGSAWYVGTALADAGMRAVIDAVIDGHGVRGPYADTDDVEYAARERDGVRTGFILNHRREPVTVTAHTAGTELLTDRKITAGEPLRLEPADVLIIRED